ncbi:MAG: M1 family metallopeptidase [candidate division KSB1 bacterium]|nr:M1 family metallopeptidase [candidate division KSB1 bacterium]
MGRSSPRLSRTAPLVWLLLLAAVAARGQRMLARDPRELYDVLSYHLAFTVHPDSQRVDGVSEIRVRFLSAGSDSLVLDAGPRLEILGVEQPGTPPGALPFRKWGERLSVALPGGSSAGQEVAVRVRFRYVSGGEADPAVLFQKTEDGRPWVNTSCQLSGAHQWWPCKASFYHPEDKPDSVWIDLTFPDTLYGVANGRFLGEDRREGWRTTRWLMVHPRLTYLVAMYVGPYALLTQPYEAHGERRQLQYFVLRRDTARARAEFFPRIPELLRCYERWFGPFPFWEEKFALVQSNIPGMEHSTAVAVGPIFPYTLRPGEPNPLASYEEYFNYMAVHELAHEWWGNAVSAVSWGDFWLHEAFATYAEALWVEQLYGPEVLHQYMAKLSFRIDSLATVYRPRHATAREAYHLNIYYKGAWVLHMLRYVMGDSAFFKALRDFQLSHRYGQAATSDFQKLCERIYGDDLSWFFLEWLYRPGWPKIQVQCTPRGRQLDVKICDTCFVRNAFRMPVDLFVETERGAYRRRVWATPGCHSFALEFPEAVRRAEPIGLRWILDGPKRGKLWYFTDLDFIKGDFVQGLEFTEDRKLYVGSDSASWISPVRFLFPGAKWLRLYVDAGHEPRHAAIRLKVREPRLVGGGTWLDLAPDGSFPPELREARRIQYRLEFGALKGEEVRIPKVVLEYQ